MQTHEVPLASVLLSLKQTPVASVALQNDPPRIFYADRPASLVVFDGEPVVVAGWQVGAFVCGEHELGCVQRRGARGTC